MILELASLSPGKAYRLLISAVVPRPIAFISSLSPEGVRNLAPFSYFTGVGPDPPTVAISIFTRKTGPKDTLRNILETKEFVINIATEEIAEAVTKTSGDFNRDIDEFEFADLTPAPCRFVTPPRVQESPVSLECRLYDHLVVGDGPLRTTLIVGEVIAAHIRDDLWDEAMIRADKLRPIARLGANFYTTLGTIFAQDRPEVDEQGNPK